MKKRFLFIVTLAFALVCAMGLAACKGDEVPEAEKRIPYEGIYKVTEASFSFLGSTYTLKLGDGFLSALLTEDMAVLELKEGGDMVFDVNLFSVAYFNLTGTWMPDEEDEKKIKATVSNETITATCDGESVGLTYEGIDFTLRKK